jgi:hypothetical protein
MNEIVGSLNQFFKKISKNEIHFEIPEQYSISKKKELSTKTKPIDKDPKKKVEE